MLTLMGLFQARVGRKHGDFIVDLVPIILGYGMLVIIRVGLKDLSRWVV